MEKSIFDFYKMRVRRNSDVAEIIFDHDEQGNPVRLLGFQTDADLDDNTVRKQGYEHYQQLMQHINNTQL